MSVISEDTERKNLNFLILKAVTGCFVFCFLRNTCSIFILLSSSSMTIIKVPAHFGFVPASQSSLPVAGTCASRHHVTTADARFSVGVRLQQQCRDTFLTMLLWEKFSLNLFKFPAAMKFNISNEELKWPNFLTYTLNFLSGCQFYKLHYSSKQWQCTGILTSKYEMGIISGCKWI